MRIHSLALIATLAALPALAQSNALSGNSQGVNRPATAANTGPSPTSGSDVGPFRPGNPILNPVDPPRYTTTEPSTVVVPPLVLSPEDALAAEIAGRHRIERTERDMDRVERENDRAAARAAVTPPPIAGAFTGSTDPRDR